MLTLALLMGLIGGRAEQCADARRLDGTTATVCAGHLVAVRTDMGSVNVLAPDGSIVIVRRGRVESVVQ